MQEPVEVENESRRSSLSGSGKVIAGAALATTVLGSQLKNAEAYTYKSGYRYEKLDPEKVAQITYENYFSKWCASSVIAGFAQQLETKVGGLWKGFPIDAMRLAHGRMAGWGALCGTLTGAGTIIDLVTNDTEVAEGMANDLAFFYSEQEMPMFTPKEVLKAELNDMTIAGTPVCHISVGRWMRSSGEPFLSDARAERCARLAADIARETAKMLNAWADGKYTTRHKPLHNVAANGITSQNNCMDCHGNDVPAAENYQTLEK